MYPLPEEVPPLPMTVPSKSVLLCDVPFLEGIETDLPFRSHNVDVPDDLLACAPINGWDSPPESPVHVSPELLDGVDTMLDNKLADSLFEEATPGLYWTPPSSPEATTECEEFLDAFPGIDAFGIPDQIPQLHETTALASPVRARPSKRKSSSSGSVDDREKKRIRDKAEQARIARTEACEQAVRALAHTKNDEDPESKRHTHNVLERKRRNDLKNSYQLLRERVPSLEDDDRAPTGKILLHAVEFITHLKNTEEMLTQSVAQARAENERLRRKHGLL
jgi:Myc proto-oncogene protein